MTSPGEVLKGRYELTEKLGKGAMGSVWKAYDIVLERTVAVKELITDPAGGEALEVRLERVRREALALAKVEHAAIVTIHDLIYVRSAEDPWIVMSYAHGSSLYEILAAGGRLSDRQVAAIGLAVLEGLMACHERSVYHRDVKPANIVVGEDGSVRLVDFGIVRMVGKRSLTAPTSTLGTLEFMAPELFEKQSEGGSATDLWALAVTLYCALTGTSPFWAKTQRATYAAIVSKDPPEPRCGGPLAGLVMRMLRKHPADRLDAAKVAGILRGVAGLSDSASRVYRPAPGLAAERQGGTGYVPRQPPPARSGGNEPIDAGRRASPLYGMPPPPAAKMIAEWSADRAAVELLALDPTGAAKIINQSAVPFAGEVLSAVAANQPVRARKILEIVTADLAGRLLDHMSASATAGTLALPPAAGAVDLLAEADVSTAVGALTGMPADRASPLVQAMGETHAVEVLAMMPDPATVAGILSHVFPATRGQALLNRLPVPFRALVIKHMQATSGLGDPATSPWRGP